MNFNGSSCFHKVRRFMALGEGVNFANHPLRMEADYLQNYSRVFPLPFVQLKHCFRCINYRSAVRKETKYFSKGKDRIVRGTWASDRITFRDQFTGEVAESNIKFGFSYSLLSFILTQQISVSIYYYCFNSKNIKFLKVFH